MIMAESIVIAAHRLLSIAVVCRMGAIVHNETAVPQQHIDCVPVRVGEYARDRGG